LRDPSGSILGRDLELTLSAAVVVLPAQLDWASVHA